MNDAKVNNLIFDFYKFVYNQNDYSEFYDEDGHFDFGKLMAAFKTVIVTKIGKKNFVAIMKQLLTVNESKHRSPYQEIYYNTLSIVQASLI